ncbi:MAG: hypothetical protein Tsb005_15500 [Gammaproteobacteria bacterium]
MPASSDTIKHLLMLAYHDKRAEEALVNLACTTANDEVIAVLAAEWQANISEYYIPSKRVPAVSLRIIECFDDEKWFFVLRILERLPNLNNQALTIMFDTLYHEDLVSSGSSDGEDEKYEEHYEPGVRILDSLSTASHKTVGKLVERLFTYRCCSSFSPSAYCIMESVLQRWSLSPPDKIITKLLIYTEDKDAIFPSLWTLKQLTAPNEIVLKTVIQLTNHPDREVRFAALDALLKLLPHFSGELLNERLDAIIKQVNDYDNDICFVALEILAKQRNFTKKMIKAIVKAAKIRGSDRTYDLYDSDTVSGRAEHLLQRLSKKYPEEVSSALLEAVVYSDEKFRDFVQMILIELGETDTHDKIFKILALGIRSQDILVRFTAMEVLDALDKLVISQHDRILICLANKIDAPLKFLISTTEDHKQVEVVIANTLNKEAMCVAENLIAFALEKARSSTSPLPMLVKLINTSQPSAEETLTLLAATRDEYNNVRWVAKEALNRLIEKPSNEIIAGLKKASQNANGSVRYVASDLLGKIACRCEDTQKSHAAILILLEVATDSDWYVRRSALQSLGDTRKLEDRVVAALLKGAEDSDWQVQAAVFNILVEMPNFPVSIKVILPWLARTMHDYYIDGVRRRVLNKLVKIPSNEVIAGLEEASRDANSSVRNVALGLLGKIACHCDDTQKSSAAISILLKAATDSDWQVRESALKELTKLPSLTNEVTAVLLTATEDSAWEVRYIAFRALDKLPYSDKLEAVLLKGMRDSVWKIQQVVLNILIKKPSFLAVVFAEVFTMLSKRLNDEDEDVRYGAKKILIDLLTPQIPLVYAELIIAELSNFLAQKNCLDDFVDSDSLVIPLPHLIRAYPTSADKRKHAQATLQYHLSKADTLLVKLDAVHYQCTINKQVVVVECAHPEQLNEDLAAIRWAPQIALPSTSLKVAAIMPFFKDPKNSNNEQSKGTGASSMLEKSDSEYEINYQVLQ